MFDELSTEVSALDEFTSHNLLFSPITIATFDNFLNDFLFPQNEWLVG